MSDDDQDICSKLTDEVHEQNRLANKKARLSTRYSISQMQQRQRKWKTAMGKWFPGQKVVLRGQTIHEDLLDTRGFEMMLFAITGRRMSQAQVELFESVYVLCASYPDPRIWNNRVVALSESAGSTSSLGFAIGTAVSESTLFGMQANIRSYDLISSCMPLADDAKALQAHLTFLIDEQKAKGFSAGKHAKRSAATLAGYGRPVVNGDERMQPMVDRMHALGLPLGDAFEVVFKIEDALKQLGYDWKANISPFLAAMGIEAGLARQEYYNFMIMSHSYGMLGVISDPAYKTRNSFFPFACQQVDYQGVSSRSWSQETQQSQ